ncbi:MAG: DUF1552 domain-containing protein [Planctomycetota bacterium]
MTTSVRRLALDRRTFLRGSACAVALPWLDAMQPACSPPRAEPVRCLFVFAPNGRNMKRWRPVGEGAATVLGGTLESLEPLREHVTVLSGLAIDGGRDHGDGFGDHARAGGSFLTCAHPKKTGGVDIRAGQSIDQRIAERVGAATRFPSLELGLERGASAGVCDSGYSCAYTSNVSWRSPSTPVTKETDPRAVFTRLFGDPQQAGDAEAAARRRALERSVLDAALADAKALAGKLGARDRQKFDDYLAAVRELELRLARLDGEGPATKVPDGLLRGGHGIAERMALMYELIALAFASDSTRVVTFMLGNAGSNASHRFLDVPEGHHDLSHHGGDQKKLERIARIDRFQVEQFARFGERLRGAKASAGDLLQQSLLVFGSAIGDGNRHNHDDLPVLLAGGGGGAKARGHVRLGEATPMANLYVAVQRAMGAGEDAFADSNGVIDLA